MPLAHTSLRYFNVVGSGYPDLRDTSPHNLFPIVFEQLVAGKTPYINGDDYPTRDGTCVRDYIHVSDLAASHVAAAKALADGRELEPVYNLGSGSGLSVREIMEAVARVTEIDFTPEIHPRRPGDPAQIVATGELAERDLAWQMRHTVDQMVASAWEARQAAPRPPDVTPLQRLLRAPRGRETRPSQTPVRLSCARNGRRFLRNTNLAEFCVTLRVHRIQPRRGPLTPSSLLHRKKKHDTTRTQFRRHRLDVDLGGAGVVDDTRPRTLLRRHGPRQERAQHDDDELRRARAHLHPLGALRVLLRLRQRHRLRPARRPERVPRAGRA